MAKKKHKAPSRDCEKCKKPYHPQSNNCPHCGAANPTKADGAAAKKKSAKPKGAKAKRTSAASTRQAAAITGIVEIREAVKFAKDNFGGNLDTAIKQLESLDGIDVAETLAALKAAKEIQEM